MPWTRWGRSKTRGRSGREPLDGPAVIVTPVAEAVVQAVLARLPELDRLRYEQVAAPEVGHGNGGRRRPALLEFLDAPGEFIARADDPRLPACPGSDLRSVRPGPEVRLAVLARHRDHAALGRDLALQCV